MIQLTNLQSRIQGQLSRPLSLYGIGLTEYLILRSLKSAPAHRMRRIDLAQAVGLSASGVTRVLNPMEKIGLVEKDHVERDARVRLVVLTEAGTRVFDEASTSFNQVAESLLKPISPEQQKALAGLVNALL
ncbi:MarR family winged helix-turn-helix transcriptional regulator [Eoetvoesiella caeni]|uniref:MarR family winged helix-turn-helix transcriptional regulator n=1 Tax=Eoetvoesiella caeni TaxID=645616 RepID=UPI001B870D28|nr:MarR family transcriptional regulator [Eoetvoesiella caeni]MCI2809745.1 MarR family transcriptional regulator [Eoetvoesiella caeni]